MRDDGAIVAIVDNDLLQSPWKCGDEVIVQQSNVLETSDPNDMTFASLLAALKAVSDAAILWRELRVRDGSGVRAKPGTRRHILFCLTLIERDVVLVSRFMIHALWSEG